MMNNVFLFVHTGCLTSNTRECVSKLCFLLDIRRPEEQQTNLCFSTKSPERLR